LTQTIEKITEVLTIIWPSLYTSLAKSTGRVGKYGMVTYRKVLDTLPHGFYNPASFMPQYHWINSTAMALCLICVTDAARYHPDQYLALSRMSKFDLLYHEPFFRKGQYSCFHQHRSHLLYARDS
jgi:hypothetical protein